MENFKFIIKKGNNTVIEKEFEAQDLLDMIVQFSIAFDYQNTELTKLFKIVADDAYKSIKR